MQVSIPHAHAQTNRNGEVEGDILCVTRFDEAFLGQVYCTDTPFLRYLRTPFISFTPELDTDIDSNLTSATFFLLLLPLSTPMQTVVRRLTSMNMERWYCIALELLPTV